MKNASNYIDTEPTLFLRDIALDLIKLSEKYLNKSVSIDDKHYRFTQTVDYHDIAVTEPLSKSVLLGTLVSDDNHHMMLSLDKIIDLFDRQ